MKKKKEKKEKIFPPSRWKGKGGWNLQILIHVLQLLNLLFSMQGKQFYMLKLTFTPKPTMQIFPNLNCAYQRHTGKIKRKRNFMIMMTNYSCSQKKKAMIFSLKKF